MTSITLSSPYTLGEEIANSVTHGVGAVLSIAGLAVLTGFAVALGDSAHVVSCAIFGATLILLYTASTLYHAIPQPRAKQVLRLIDHSAIFLLIAGTYTPFMLVSLDSGFGTTLCALIWFIAFAGIAAQGKLIRKAKWVNAALYIAMGWVVVVAIKPLADSVAPGGLALLVAGGLSYTLGTVFYVWKKLPYHHAIWHLFVLAGSALHFFAVLFYVILLAA